MEGVEPERRGRVGHVALSGATGTFYARPGDTSFDTTAASKWRGAVLVSWFDEAGHHRFGRAISGWPRCP